MKGDNNLSVHHKAQLTGCEGMSKGEEICVLNSLRFDLLGLLLVSELFSTSGDFKATFAMIFLAVEKECKDISDCSILSMEPTKNQY